MHNPAPLGLKWERLRKGGRIIESKEKALAAVAAAQDKKGHNLTVIDLEGECSYADYLVIVSASSERQTTAIAEAVVDALRERHQLRPIYREGRGGWVLLDYGDVVIHVFLEDARAFYDIDRLWSRSPRVPIPLPVEGAGVEGAGVEEEREVRLPATAAMGRRRAR